MRTSWFPVVVSVLLLGVSHGATASPIAGTSANTLPEGTFMIDVWSAWLDFTESYDEGEEAWIDFPGDATVRAVSFAPRLYYGVTDRFTMRLAVPLEYRLLEGFVGLEGEFSSSGLGDICVEPKLKLYQSDSGLTKFSLIGGVRLPTGDTDSNPRISDGSTDYIVGAVVTHGMGAITLHSLVGYWINGEDDDETDVPDVWAVNATIEGAVSDSWSLVGEVIAKLGEDPSEYYRVDLCPGLSWTNRERLTVGLAARLSTWAKGGGGVSWVNYDWAPFLRMYYRFF